MKAVWTFTRAFLSAAALLTLAAAPSSADQPTGGTKPKVTDGKSGKPGSAEAGTESKQQDRTRRSSGKQIIEDATTDEKAKPGKAPQPREGKSAGTRIESGRVAGE